MNISKSKQRRKYSVPALDNAFEILRVLSRNRFKESTVTEIANALSLSPATCYRILKSLEDVSVVRYIADKKRYTLGPYLVALGERAKEHLDYISIIKPYLEKVTEQTGMTSMLVNKVSKDKVALVDKVEGNDFGVSVSIGRHFSITDGAFGMCFLAYLDKEERIYHLKENPGLKSFSEDEIATIESCIVQLKQDGYSITNGDYIKGLCGVAAPIIGDGGNVEMSIALIGFSEQYEPSELKEKGVLLKEAANVISLKIGSL